MDSRSAGPNRLSGIWLRSADRRLLRDLVQVLVDDRPSGVADPPSGVGGHADCAAERTLNLDSINGLTRRQLLT